MDLSKEEEEEEETKEEAFGLNLGLRACMPQSSRIGRIRAGSYTETQVSGMRVPIAGPGAFQKLGA